jgi:hypothetical protein
LVARADSAGARAEDAVKRALRRCVVTPMNALRASSY